ncbi:MAG: septal ring lytic transglycosylase RlpA family protein [Gammaproteobacteria bacterium]|nr:septal ring lytic transglycosylase RlpA family protein [Gammaproteobacteria bacterium]
MKYSLFGILILLLLTACSTKVPDSGPSGHVDVSGIPEVIPWDEPHSRGGNMSSYKVLGKRYYVLRSAEGFTERGVASWYGNKFHGNNTSNGEVYDMYAMTAAHKRLPLPSYVKVTNLNNKRSVVVRVNDRGPFHKGRIIDLSYVAAKKLGITQTGTAPVEIVAITGSSTTVGNQTVTQPVSKNESIAVQVGAFSLKSSAQEVSQKLANHFMMPVTISEIISNGKKLFRVRLGPFDSINKARDWIEKLDKTTFGPASLVYLN